MSRRVATAHQAGTAHTLAEERTKNSESALNAAVVARDAALAAFSEGVAATLSDAQAKLAAALDEQQKVAAELASLESTIAAQNERVEAAIREARAIAEQAQAGLDAASTERTNAITAHALQVGRLEELRRLRDAQDLATAESKLKSASDRQAALPVPERIVTEADLTVARDAKTTAESELECNPARDRADSRRARASRRRRCARATTRRGRSVRVGGAAGAGNRGRLRCVVAAA